MSFGKPIPRPKFTSQSDQMSLHLCSMKRKVRRVARVWGGCDGVRAMCEPIPVPSQALLVDCSTEKPPRAAGAAARDYVCASGRAFACILVLVCSSASSVLASESVVRGLAPSSEGEAARRAGMSDLMDVRIL
ncbi:hypothetical protein B0H19DRAFT_1383201 [Mycena capillaripes]|nr:hypothetical protein B0H19DRAFT_1383201 [Mycena capillaripes]